MMPLDENNYCVIMAGGVGSRFWPKSRTQCPKQFLDILGTGRTLIQQTFDRFRNICNPENIYVVTGEDYAEIVSEQLPELNKDNILCEPIRRNTAPCIAYASYKIFSKNPEAQIVVSPADHFVGDTRGFEETIKRGLQFIKFNTESFLTVGIIPTRPETGYGYINFGEEKGDVFEVKKFVEKPDLKTAKSYLSSGKYLWNSGMFVWKISSIMKNLSLFMPDVYEGALKIGESFGGENFSSMLENEFEKFPSESIDFGIMEKAEDIYTIPGSFGWDDVGSWLAVERINETDEFKNFTEGDVMLYDTKRTTICGGKRLIAAVGARDIIIVDTDDVLLVCSKNSTQDVKQIIAQLKEKNRNNLV